MTSPLRRSRDSVTARRPLQHTEAARRSARHPEPSGRVRGLPPRAAGDVVPALALHRLSSAPAAPAPQPRARRVAAWPEPVAPAPLAHRTNHSKLRPTCCSTPFATTSRQHPALEQTNCAFVIGVDVSKSLRQPGDEYTTRILADAGNFFVPGDSVVVVPWMPRSRITWRVRLHRPRRLAGPTRRSREPELACPENSSNLLTPGLRERARICRAGGWRIAGDLVFTDIRVPDGKLGRATLRSNSPPCASNSPETRLRISTPGSTM